MASAPTDKLPQQVQEPYRPPAIGQQWQGGPPPGSYAPAYGQYQAPPPAYNAPPGQYPAYAPPQGQPVYQYAAPPHATGQYPGPPAPQPYGQYTTGGPPQSEHSAIPINPQGDGDSEAKGVFGGLGGQDWEIPDDKKLTEDIDIAIRMAFVRKVYGILCAQLTVTFGMALWFNLHTAAGEWLYNNPWVLILAAILCCVTVCGLTCVPSAARKSPTNYIMLGTLSVCMGAVLGYSTAAVSTPAFAIAAGMTAAVTLAVTLFAFQTKWDFTGMGVYAFVALIVLMIFGIVCAFVRNRITQIVYGALGALLFSFYLIMDTQKIVGGKHRKYEFSIDDYAFAALALYLDIINLFLYILTIVNASSN